MPEADDLKPIALLLVDDHPTFVRIAKDFLSKHDDVVVIGTAEEGAQGIALAKELHPDIVLLDMALPDMSGLEVIPRLREALADMGIIALTGLAMEGYRKMALRLGADEVVPKADMNTDLLPAIRRVAQEKSSRCG